MKSTIIYLFSEFHTMLLLQQMKASLLSVDIQVVHQADYQQSLNTKTEVGEMLETWHKVEFNMVQSPLVQ